MSTSNALARGANRDVSELRHQLARRPPLTETEVKDIVREMAGVLGNLPLVLDALGERLASGSETHELTLQSRKIGDLASSVSMVLAGHA
jgi:hypothetical protein